MRRIGLAWLACVFVSISLLAQSSAPPPPQSARQALIEMVMGKAPDDFIRHLPDAARQALIHKGETPESSIVLRIGSIGREIAHPGEHVETFESGPNILVTEDESTHERAEIAVEHDSLNGEEDEIELSVHVYKDGQPQELPVIPRLTFTMKQEKDVWRLTELTAAARVPLTDPDYLKGLRRQQDEANESAARMRVGMIVAAQTSYAAAHPDIGYSCSLPNLSDPGQSKEEWNGYRLTLSGCAGTPSRSYHLIAVPIDPDSEGKTYCADESGKMRFLTGGKPSSCFRDGQVLETPQYPAMSAD